MLKVSSIFYSIQGEGFHAGRAFIFIRLFGCNLTCDFCDDELHKTTMNELSFDDIYKKIQKFPSKNIIITGGEPSIYILNDFIEFLQEKNYFVSVESNGYNFSNIKNANWITYSPKDWENIQNEGFDEYKFIVDESSDIEKLINLKSDKEIFIQPQNFMHKPNMNNVNYCVELVKKYPDKFRLSLQMHKFIGVD